jgi:hypothetical protein
VTRKRKVEIGERVALIGNHPWNGFSGEVIKVPDMAGRVTVRLENGVESMAWPRQWAPYWERERQK